MRLHRLGLSLRGFALVSAALGVAACGSGQDALNKRLASLQDQVAALRSHGDRLEERLESLELHRDAEAAAAKSVAERSQVVDHPDLKVVRLEPGAAEPPQVSTRAQPPPAEDATDDQSPRPVIRVYGSRVDVRGDTPEVKIASDADRGGAAARGKRREE